MLEDLVVFTLFPATEKWGNDDFIKKSDFLTVKWTV